MAVNQEVMVAEKVTGTGNIAGGDPIDIIGLYVVSTSSAGQIVIDNGSGGNKQYDMDTPANQQGITIVNFPVGIIPFPAGANVSTFSNVTSMTVFYRKRT